MRAWDVGHGYPRHRRIEVEKRLVGHHGSDLRAEPAGSQILMDDQAAARAADAVEHHVAVPWHQRAQVDDVGADAFRRRLAARHHRAPGDDGDLVAFARLLRLAERQDELVAGPRPPRPAVVQHGAMFEEDHRVVAAQRCAKQPDRILGIGRHRDLPAGIMDELHLVGLAVPRVAAFEEAAGNARAPSAQRNGWRCASASSRNR